MKGEAKKKQYNSLDNLLFGFRKIAEVSKGFALLFLAEIPLNIAISLLAAYLPSMLVADITGALKGQTIEGVIADLAVVGGGLALLCLVQRWLKSTQQKKEWGVRLALSQKLSSASMETAYANVESSGYQNLFSQVAANMTWSTTYTSNLLNQVVSVVTAIIGMILYTGMLSGVSVWILLIVVGGTIMNFVVGMLSNHIRKNYERKCWRLDNEMSYLTRTVSSYEVAKDVHLYHMTPWLTRRYDKSLKDRMYLTVIQQACYYMEGFSGVLAQLLYEGFAYLYLIGCVCEGTMDAASFVFYIGIVKGFAGWCSTIVGNMKELHNSSLNIGFERELWELLKHGVQEGEQELTVAKGHVPEIMFRNVTFRYEGAEKPTIVNLNLTLKAGENIALVGQNGAGKTTFIKLLCGFYDPTEGEILIDGVNRSCYTKESWMRMLTGVFQDMGFFPMSLGENLVPEHPEQKEEERLWECLRMAELEDKIKSLPNGLNTMFGLGVYEGAVEFSGGERQRLMLARALYKETPLLLLDEPTSALDALMENELYEKYRQFSEGKTTVFISHRLASTRFCDRILLMENGVIIEEGTHETLLAKGGSYAKMYEVQSRYYQEQEDFEGTFAADGGENA